MNLDDIETWRHSLGLFPIPLHHDFDPRPHFLLLNGLRGSFCLDLSRNEPTHDNARSMAWSSNVGHYVALANDTVIIQPWNDPGHVDRYSLNSVLNQLEAFHAYLERSSPDASSSVVSHGVRAFRGLRTALGAGVGGVEALNAFLVFLACAHESTHVDQLDLAKWALDEVAPRIVERANQHEWQALLDDFAAGRQSEALRLNIDLLLRHASGSLFQEAHYHALISDSRQMQFEFFPPAPARMRLSSEVSGVHFTPSALSRTLVEEALRHVKPQRRVNLTVFDPACGSGEFLREVLRQLRLSGYSGTVKLIGWDISEAACAMARFALAWDLRSNDSAVAIEIRACNSLSDAEHWPRDVDLLLMNPPFVSWQDLSWDQRENLKRILGSHLRYRPDLSSAFLLKASQCLATGGVLGCILPSSFLSLKSAGPIREELGGAFVSKLIARLGSHTLFSGAFVDTALYIAVAGASGKETPLVLWSDYRSGSAFDSLRALRKVRSSGSTLGYPLIASGYSIYYNPEVGRGGQSWAPRPYESWALVKSLAHLPRIGQIFDVRQGSRTGRRHTLVLSKNDWSSLPAVERPFFRPAVLNGAISDGVLQDAGYAFFPYGRRAIATERDLRRLVPTYYERFLNPNRSALMKRTRVKSDQWWLLSEKRAWQVEPLPKLVSTYFGQRGSFAWDEKGRFVVVQGFGWFPERDLEASYSRRVALCYLALFNSYLFERLLAALSNHVGGGQWDLSPRFVNEIPLPWLGVPNNQAAPTSSEMIDDLAELGDTIRTKSLGGLTAADQGRLEEAVAGAYGLDQGVIG